MKFKRNIIIIYSLLFVFLFVMGIFHKMGFTYNPTSSLPKGIYKLTETDPKEYKKGDLIMFCLPEAEALKAKKRGYWKTGYTTCPGDFPPLIKKVIGVSGDSIKIKNETVHINGIALKNGKISKKDRRGRELKPCGDIVVGDNEIFAMSLYNPNSWDSRYFGAIDKNSIIGKTKAIWTW